MKYKLFFWLRFLCFLTFCLSLPQISQASKSLDVVINEIAWMGTNISANDEWIELYNNTTSNINLDGWVLKSEDRTPEIKLAGLISVNGFFLLERTDDETVSGVIADQIYKGALGNNGENLKLFDSSGNLIDQINCSSGWFAGGNTTKQTMERKNPQISGNNPENWQTSQNPGGTPKTKNSSGAIEVQTDKTITTEKSEQKLTETSFPLTYPSGIVFNEILPAPEGPDTEEEWIEIFNQNDSEVNLSGWKIKDVSGKITTYTFPKERKISQQGFLILSRPETKITLNNDGDGLILFSPDGKMVDEVNYTKAPRGQSYNRINSDWTWNINLTPGTPNITEKTGIQSVEDKSALESKEKKELAAVGEQVSRSSKFPFVLLIALTTAVFSGIIILILKKRVKNRI